MKHGAIQELFTPFTPMQEGFSSGTFYYIYNSEFIYANDILVKNNDNGKYYKSLKDENNAGISDSDSWSEIPARGNEPYQTDVLVTYEGKLYKSKLGANQYPTSSNSWYEITQGPLVNAIDKARLVKIHSRDQDISGNINTYDDIYADISNNYGNTYEFPEFAEITRDDVLQQDLQFLMAQQKNTHMIGIIAIATLAVGIFYIVRNYRTDTE
jgi:hypothetical protein